MQWLTHTFFVCKLLEKRAIIKLYMYFCSIIHQKYEPMKKYLSTIIAIAFLRVFGYSQATLPYNEDWESGTFFTHGWTVNNGDGFANAMFNGVNGSLALNMGHHIIRTGNTPTTIESPWIDATTAQTGLLYFSFNYAFLNPDSTRWQILQVHCDTGGGWQLLTEFSHFSSFDWKVYTTHLPQVLGKTFRFKFQTFPESDTAAGTWLIDNIGVWSSNTFSFKVQASVNANPETGLGIGLTWNEPVSNTAVTFNTDTLHYHNYQALDGFNTMLKWGYGVVFPLSSYNNSLLYEFEFLQNNQFVPLKRFVFKIRFIDWDSQLIIDSLGPFISDGNNEWVQKIALNLRKFNNINNLGVFVEPLEKFNSTYVIPTLALGDYTVETHSFYCSLTPPFYGFPIENELLMNLIVLDEQTGKKIYIPRHKSKPIYNLYRWQELLPLNYTIMNTSVLQDTTFNDSAVEKGWYSYFIKAIYPNHEALYSDTARAYMPTSAGFQEVANTAVVLYPNPARLQLNIASQHSIVGLEMLNNQGTQLPVGLKTPTQQLVIPLDTYAPGLYIARLKFANGMVGSYTFIKE